MCIDPNTDNIDTNIGIGPKLAWWHLYLSSSSTFTICQLAPPSRIIKEYMFVPTLPFALDTVLLLCSVTVLSHDLWAAVRGMQTTDTNMAEKAEHSLQFFIYCDEWKILLCPTWKYTSCVYKLKSTGICDTALYLGGIGSIPNSKLQKLPW